jgi:hypothetical protein
MNIRKIIREQLEKEMEEALSIWDKAMRMMGGDKNAEQNRGSDYKFYTGASPGPSEKTKRRIKAKGAPSSTGNKRGNVSGKKQKRK